MWPLLVVGLSADGWFFAPRLQLVAFVALIMVVLHALNAMWNVWCVPSVRSVAHPGQLGLMMVGGQAWTGLCVVLFDTAMFLFLCSYLQWFAVSYMLMWSLLFVGSVLFTVMVDTWWQPYPLYVPQGNALTKTHALVLKFGSVLALALLLFAAAYADQLEWALHLSPERVLLAANAVALVFALAMVQLERVKSTLVEPGAEYMALAVWAVVATWQWLAWRRLNGLFSLYWVALALPFVILDFRLPSSLVLEGYQVESHIDRVRRDLDSWLKKDVAAGRRDGDHTHAD